jgi:hypothetical protein
MNFWVGMRVLGQNGILGLNLVFAFLKMIFLSKKWSFGSNLNFWDKIDILDSKSTFWLKMSFLVKNGFFGSK